MSVRELIRRAYGKGVMFHQELVGENPNLLNWVLKPDYFHYSLPTGWDTWMPDWTSVTREAGANAARLVTR
jgi:hypothetical protein